MGLLRLILQPNSFADPRTLARELFHHWTRREGLCRLALFAILSIVFVVQAIPYWPAVIDDSYITFRFVDMVVKGHGWVFNPGGPRVEGFTNFLWAVLLVPPHWLGWDLMAVSKGFGVLSGLGTMLAAWRLARWVSGSDDYLTLLAPALLATNAHFAHWSMMGLETLLQCFLITAAYWRFVKEIEDPRLLPISAVLALLAALTRFDSLYYLSPLGLYGLWALLRGRSTLARAGLWAVIAGLPFLVYTGWKVVYFGDMLPNTYWAKQRHVIFDGKDRGHEQLGRYYFAQSDQDRAEPPRWGSEDPEASVFGQRVARILHVCLAGPLKSWAWMNTWLMGVIGLSLWIFLAGRRGGRAVALLVLTPWALNVYFIHHVNGDWMPGFRFFQVGMAFIAVALAAGLIRLLALIPWNRGSLIGGIVGCWLVSAVAWEQLQTNTIYIFGRGSFIHIPREPGWWTPQRLGNQWSRGFAPPLREVSEKLLLTTATDSFIFMSDIGQPLWFAEHLNLYDVDGLVDQRLAHAPIMRGDLPTQQEILEKLLQGDESKPSRKRRNELRDMSRRIDFENHVRRNARWIMEEARPEYLLIFINHVDHDPRSPGSAYPWVSSEVHQHPRFRDYEVIWQAAKVGNAFNHLYRRRDVAGEPPPRERLDRIVRALNRNPRMPSLAMLLLKEASRTPDLTADELASIEKQAIRIARRFPADPVTTEMAYWAMLANRWELALAAHEARLPYHRDEHDTWRAIAQIHLRMDERDKATATLQKGLRYAGRRTNELRYMLASNLESDGRIEDAASILREAIKLFPDDARSWSDLATVLYRAGMNPAHTTQQRIAWLAEAGVRFERLRELDPVNAHRYESSIELAAEELARMRTPSRDP